MKQGLYTVIENKALTGDTYRMRLTGDVSAFKAPGQFLDIKLDGHFLRRPISLCDLEHDGPGRGEGVLTIIYKVLGKGTEEMTRLQTGAMLDVLTGLGNGYDLSAAGGRPLLIGGGVGIPPLYLAARRLREKGAEVTVILGYNSSGDIFYADEFKALGCDVTTATADGSAGIKGFVTDAFRQMKPDATFFYTCGPEPMLRAVFEEVYKGAGISGQLSFEERMGCGFGACMGCSVRTKSGSKRICKDGPVLKTEEIEW